MTRLISGSVIETEERTCEVHGAYTAKNFVSAAAKSGPAAKNA
jgi:hypothetical protein